MLLASIARQIFQEAVVMKRLQIMNTGVKLLCKFKSGFCSVMMFSLPASIRMTVRSR